MNTTYFLNQVMGNVFKTKTTPALPSAYWLGLSSTAPVIAGTGATEPSVTGTGYGRVQLTTSNLSAPTNGVISNTAVISFAESITDWGKMTHFAIYDAQTGGNLLMYGALNVARTVEQNTVMMIKVGELTLTLSNP